MNVAAGARTRWAAIFSGLWMLVILLLFSGVIGVVAQSTLAALMIVAGIQSIRPAQIAMILRTGAISQIALTATFVATLLLPVAAAVGVGVVLSLMLQLNREAMDLRVIRLLPSPKGWREAPVPKRLEKGEVVAVDIYGSLMYAGPKTLEFKLPDPAAGSGSAVVVRLRGRTELGATFFLVIDRYARALNAVGSRLFLSGVDPVLLAQHRRSHRERDRGLMEVFPAGEVIGRSTDAAIAAAEDWVARWTPESPSPGSDGPDDDSADDPGPERTD